MFDNLTKRFDEQFVPNTDKNTLKNDLYQRFITEGATEDEAEPPIMEE